MIKAAIFDMDGLLIDSEPLWQEAVIGTFAEHRIDLVREQMKETMGLRVDVVVEHWFNYALRKNPPKKEATEKVIERVAALIREKGHIMPGAKETVEFFAKEKMSLAIASSSPTKVIEAALERISIGEHMSVIHSGENEVFAKPHPAIYITTARKLNLEPEFCLAFEDTLNGVLAVKAARMKCVAVPNEMMRGDKRFCIADLVLGSLSDFRPEHLKNL